ncbi:MAG: type II toxin-antitoxin system HicA family toxin [Peptococcaceae bacterium]|nr:type II toxin-antitoxin system HicA family toxin [Peptococcaceae bacterium]
MKFREVEKLILDDGWQFKSSRGAHHQYIHPAKPGNVTIPFHRGDTDPRTVKSILKQAGIDGQKGRLI